MNRVFLLEGVRRDPHTLGYKGENYEDVLFSLALDDYDTPPPRILYVKATNNGKSYCYVRCD